MKERWKGRGHLDPKVRDITKDQVFHVDWKIKTGFLTMKFL
jgi:hypothetical protein